MSRIAEKSQLSPQEYLAWDREQVARHEFFQGEVFAMAGGSLRHNALCSNVIAALHAALRDRDCIVLTSDQRVGMDAQKRYVYPDTTVVCGGAILEEGTDDVLLNPTILVEVLSSSTEQYDRGLKWEGYQRLASLTDYLLVSQTEPRIEHFRRAPDGTWIYRSVGAHGSVELSKGRQLAVEVVFANAMSLPGD